MSTTAQVLSQKSLTIIFAYAPTGLGHLRVTKALYDGLPKTAHSMLLGSHDQAIAGLHRFASIHPITRSMMEISQGKVGVIEDVVTYAIRTYLRSHTKLIYEQITTILDQLLILPKVVLIIATHTSLAHQIAAIKDKLQKEKQVKVIFIVQVTDDTPQHIWYVPEADLTFVPSDRIRSQIAMYGRAFGLPKNEILVSPYPVSPTLALPLKKEEFTNRQKQMDPQSKSHIQLAIPISGAAVGTKYFSDVMAALRTFSPRFMFHVVSKKAPYTEKFLNDLLTIEYAKLYSSGHDREVVDKYDEVYVKNIISLEITKPSEQAFKALISPKQIGGSVLLFSTPVGKQEYDNLFFLRRHNLIPTDSQQETLYRLAAENKPIAAQNKELTQNPRNWRGLRIPDEAVASAHFIWWCLCQRIFKKMANWKTAAKNENGHADELTSDGVALFWQKVAEFLTNKSNSF